MRKPKQSSGVQVWAVFFSGAYYDGGDQLLSLHRTEAGAKAARSASKYDNYDLEIQKYELED